MSEPQNIYEQTLVIRSQIGDDAAFEELMKSYGPRLLHFTRKMMQTSPNIVEDLNQEIWLAIYRGLPSLIEAGKFRPWAFRIARDRVYREFRRRKLPIEPLQDANNEPLCEPDNTSEIDREELYLALEILSPEHREVLVLRFIEEMSYEEIAQTTGGTLGTVRSRLHYGKRALKTAMEERL